jgi:RNA methyltransferase, TrmH family
MDRPRASDEPEVIHSADNSTVKFVRSLRQRKSREVERVFVVEGARLFEDALTLGVRPLFVLLRKDQASRILELNDLAGSNLEFRILEQRLFDSLADTTTPQGVLAVFPIPTAELPAVERPIVVVVDRMSDPGNLGTLLRVSVGAGANAVFLTEGTVDPYNPKVVRAGMGAQFRIPILGLDGNSLAWIELKCSQRVLADASGGTEYSNLDWTSSTALLLGPETGGFSEEIERMSTTRAKIPLENSLESLNAAVAGAVMLFEASRQRRAAQTE